MLGPRNRLVCVIHTSNPVETMRQLLQSITKVSIGVLCVVSLPGRILMEDIWAPNFYWDDSLPNTSKTKWQANFKIPRCIRRPASAMHHDCHLARFIARDIHRRFLHASCLRILKEIRTTYYTTRARSLVRREPEMATLPANRTDIVPC